MNCSEFEAVAPELARGGGVGAAVEEQARAHADSCELCRARLANQLELSRGLRALAEETTRRAPTPRLEQALREAYRENAGVHEFPTEAARSWWARWGPVAAGVAAAVAIAAGVLFVDHDRGAREAEAVRPTWKPLTQNAGVEPDPLVPALGDSETIPDSGITEPSPRVRTQELATAAQSQTVSLQEVVTDFFPLLYEEGWNERSSAHLVRVSLPRSALLEFGFPLREGAAAGRVQADVLLAEDGTARAIRFVHPRPDSPRASER